MTYDGGSAGSAGGGGITITGRAVDGATGQPLSGGVFGVLNPKVSCSTFFSGTHLDMTQVVASSETNSTGAFQLDGVPRGATYSAFFIYGSNYICENTWLDIPGDAGDSDLGDIKMSFN